MTEEKKKPLRRSVDVSETSILLQAEEARRTFEKLAEDAERELRKLISPLWDRWETML